MINIYDNAVPENWLEDELRHATIRKRGYSWTKEDETVIEESSTVPVIRIPNIQEKLDLANLLHLRNVSPDAVRASAVSRGWILFVGSNGNPDRIGDSVLMTEDRPMVFASFLMGIASKNPERITPEFLAAWLRLHNVHEAFSKTSQQTTGLANFSWSAVKRLPLRFPSDIGEQKTITSLLQRVDDAISAAGTKLTAARRLKTALMQQLFTRGIPGRHKRFKQTKIGEIPEEWDLIPLGKVTSIVSGFALNSDRAPRSNPYQYLTVIHVQRERLDLTDVRYLEVYPNELPHALLEEGDILVVEGHANSSEIGRAALATSEVEGFAYQNHIFRVRLLPDTDIDRVFLLGVLNSERMRRHWVATCNTSSGLNTINRRGLRRALIQKPKLDEQQDIVKLIKAVNRNIGAVEYELETFERLKRSLLQNLLTGKVRVKPLETSP